MTKYLSSISESSLFNATLAPSPAKSRPFPIRVVVMSTGWKVTPWSLGGSFRDLRPGLVFCCGVFNRSPERFRDLAQIPWLVTGTGLNPGLAD